MSFALTSFQNLRESVGRLENFVLLYWEVFFLFCMVLIEPNAVLYERRGSPPPPPPERFSGIPSLLEKKGPLFFSNSAFIKPSFLNAARTSVPSLAM